MKMSVSVYETVPDYDRKNIFETWIDVRGTVMMGVKGTRQGIGTSSFMYSILVWMPNQQTNALASARDLPLQFLVCRSPWYCFIKN
jgi:hypothetical protein